MRSTQPTGTHRRGNLAERRRHARLIQLPRNPNSTDSVPATGTGTFRKSRDTLKPARRSTPPQHTLTAAPAKPKLACPSPIRKLPAPP